MHNLLRPFYLQFLKPCPYVCFLSLVEFVILVTFDLDKNRVKFGKIDFALKLRLIRNDKFEIHLKNRFLTPYGILVSSYPISLFQNEN